MVTIMAKTYNKANIINTYFTIIILDSCGDIYDEIYGIHCPQTLIECGKRILEMKQHDKELGDEFGVWDYRIGKHEEDDDSDWQTVYKVYKYRGRYKIKVDERW